MKKRVFTVLLSLLVMGVGYGQTILSEGFENLSMPPSGWTEWAECDECEPESWYGWTLDNHSHSGNRSAAAQRNHPQNRRPSNSRQGGYDRRREEEISVFERVRADSVECRVFEVVH